MRILLLAQWYPPIIGGEENHVAGLAAGLTRMGHQVAVATLRQPGLAEREERDGVVVHRLPGTLQRFDALFTDQARRSASPFPDPETTLALARLAADFQPEVIHAHNWLVHSWMPLKAKVKAPLVVSLHDYSLVCAKKNLIRRGVQCDGPGLAKCLRCAGRHYGAAKGTVTVAAGFVSGAVERAAVDLFLPVSEAVREGVGLDASDARVSVIPNFLQAAEPLPPAELDQLARQLPSSPFLLFAGAFSRQKGIDHLRSAFSAANLPVPLVLIGYSATDAPGWLSHRQENVHVLENWPRAGVAMAMERSMATVVPSVWREPCPTVVLEAMRAGSPVIASRIGGIPELVSDESAMLVPPADVPALADALRNVVADESRRARMGDAGRARVPEFTAERVIPRIESAYRALLQRRGQAA